jgi:putative phage-type endonuclease
MPLPLIEKQKRRLSIGGSDIGAIAGVSPHKTALKLYLEKLGLDEDEGPDSDAQIWGNLLEEPIAQFYAQKHGVTVHSFKETLVHPDYPFLTANPDRVILEYERLIEIKTTGMGGIEFWRDPESPGSLRPPQHVVLQVNWYLGFLRWHDSDIALLHFSEGFREPERYVEFPLTFDPELFHLQVELAVDFWKNHVQAHLPPQAADAEEMETYLSLSHPKHSDELIEATDEHYEIAARLDHARAQKEHWEEQEKIERNALKSLIGDKAGIKGENWVFTWKETQGSGIDWKSLAQSLKPTEEQIQCFRRSGYRRSYFRYKGNSIE